MMKRLFAGRFIRSIGYLLSVHLVALLFFFGLRVALFIATDYDFPKEISEDYALQSVAFLRGLWFDNVIACYILLLPLAVFWIAGWFGYTARWLYRSSAFFFIFSIRCVSSFPQPISLISPTSSSPSIPPYSTGSTTRAPRREWYSAKRPITFPSPWDWQPSRLLPTSPSGCRARSSF